MSPTLILAGTILWASTDLLFSSLTHKFWGIISSFGHGFTLQSQTGGATKTTALLHRVWMLKLSLEFRSSSISLWQFLPWRLTRCQAQVLRWLSSSQCSRQARSRLWQAGSVGRGWVQTLLWPQCPPVCCLPSGVGTCSKGEKTGLSASTFPRQESETDNAGAQNTSAKAGGPCGAAKKWLELDHGLSRFSRPNGTRLIYIYLEKKRTV